MKYLVYYAKTLPRDLGDDFAFVPGQTHVFIREIEADALDEAYAQMQGGHWSPHGEARPLIWAAGISHTSMSTGSLGPGVGLRGGRMADGLPADPRRLGSQSARRREGIRPGALEPRLPEGG